MEQTCAPNTYNVTGGGDICPGVNSSFPVGLSGSDAGITYQLKLDSASIGAAVAGIGNALDFGMFGTAGNYTVTGSNSACGASANMPGVATITLSVPETYYYDADHDGYHSDTQTTCENPGDNWNTATSGPDCNDSSPFIYNPIS